MIELTYDNGTLLFSGKISPYLKELREFVVFDQRIEKFRAQAYDYFTIRKLLLHDQVSINDLVLRETQISDAWSTIDLRSYQESALVNWESSNRRGLVCLPTGAGKTRLAIAAMRTTQSSCLCLVPTRVLLEQWAESIKSFYKGPVGILGDGKHKVEAITVATFESAYRHMNWLGNRFKLLVIDEAHHFGHGLRNEALVMSAAPWRLGLTATKPECSEQLDSLKELIGPIAFELGLQDLVGKHLAEFDICPVHIPLTPLERLQYDREYKTFIEYYRVFANRFRGATWQDFLKVAHRSDRGRQAISAFYRTRRIVSYTRGKKETLAKILGQHCGQRVLIFTGDTSTAVKISQDFLIPAIVAAIKRKERDQILEDFKCGLVTNVVSCKVLNEGVDVPDAEVAVILGGTSIPREHVQRIGRLLRPKDSKKARVYELIAKDTFEIRHANKRGKQLVR